ncbi:MAG: sugar phosphate isomerase/epimerase [Planctomycetota bacterium]|nr:sugar phosphate isomerase/epimerase [Planctomycetota bacterium]
MIPCLSQVCTLGSSFEDDLDGYADGACTAIELWLTKLEEYTTTHSPAEVLRRAVDRGLTLACASFQGGLLLSQGAARQAAWEQFERRLDLLAELAVPVLVVTPDFLGPFDFVDLERAFVSLHQAGELAQPRGVRLALEFQARGTFLNNLESAAGFVRSVGLRNVGLCLDTFHFATGPSKTEDLACLTEKNLFHTQFCDVADRPRELATDADRILPGEGDFHLAPIIEHLRKIGYSGCVSLELLNPIFWQIPAQQLGEIGMTSLRLVLGQADRGVWHH